MPCPMRSSPLRFTDLVSRRVGIWGVGTEGRATLQKLKSLGVVPAAVVDDAPPGPGVLATGAGGLEALSACDVVVKSPGISRYADAVGQLEGAGVAVVGGMGLWLEEMGPERVVGVTGTKGKSTTTALAGHLAKGLGVRCFVGGNIGQVPWGPAEESDTDLWVVEVSSYQVTDLWSSPAVAAVTSLHPDHLDWHGSVDNYYKDKLALCHRRGGRVTVANGTDERLRERSALLGPSTRWVEPVESATWTAKLGLRGAHNLTNALIAAACLEEMGVAGATDPVLLARAAEGFRPLPHRLETVAERGGVEFVDDSLSTNVLPTIAAAKVFEGRPLALLVGGYDRGIDYAPLGEYLSLRPAPTLVLTLPESGERARQALTERGCQAVACADIDEAVRQAAAWAPAGGVVLLSPAAPSYGVYANYEQRAAAFRAAIKSLGPEGEGPMRRAPANRRARPANRGA